MITLITLSVHIFQIFLALLVAPFLMGLIHVVQARLQGQRGASILQPYFDIRKWLVKEAFQPMTASWIFLLAPYLLVATLLLGIWLTPLVAIAPPAEFGGDAIMLVYLYLFGTLFLVLAGFESRSHLAILSTGRRLVVFALSSSVLLTSILALALRTGTSDLAGIASYVHANPLIVADPSYLLTMTACVLAMLAEIGGGPLENRRSSSALALIQEAVVREYTGLYLALIRLAEALRLFLFIGLFCSLFLPWGAATDLQLVSLFWGGLILVLKLLVFVVALAIFEMFTTTLHLRHTGLFAGVGFILALLAMIASCFSI
ncbi:MAG: NADH-quinone oxidoreductase subunit H [Chloroflexales bacterium]|nr:NADH-quinone oxidoreductase subunit H [Chloroflexales bacterium]